MSEATPVNTYDEVIKWGRWSIVSCVVTGFLLTVGFIGADGWTTTNNLQHWSHGWAVTWLAAVNICGIIAGVSTKMLWQAEHPPVDARGWFWYELAVVPVIGSALIWAVAAGINVL
ncbi:hypothetical protein KC973_03130 [Candidatus Saccharibacteria bacterium]|nr:hypothetical protein [Candidatus Saccharibacteria bacterium]